MFWIINLLLNPFKCLFFFNFTNLTQEPTVTECDCWVCTMCEESEYQSIFGLIPDTEFLIIIIKRVKAVLYHLTLSCSLLEPHLHMWPPGGTIMPACVTERKLRAKSNRRGLTCVLLTGGMGVGSYDHPAECNLHSSWSLHHICVSTDGATLCLD